MGIFGEAIHGHIGYYKTDIYGAAISAGQLVQAQGLSTQDVNNVILSSAGVGQNDSENQIIMFDPEGRGVSWTLRIAAQTDSKVSAGYSHVAYWQSTLSAFRDIDAMVYFPFITDGDVFKQLLQHEEMFNPSRWSGCMQNVQKKKAYQMQLLGGGFSLPRNLLKKTVCYILSKLATRARKYLYILVPQGAPYQAYCEAVIWQILSVIPIGLRRGLTVSTNPSQKSEDSFGIIFQQEANPARHGCDLSFHRNGNYEFLNDYYLNKNLENLVSLFVENPEMTEVCYQEMELPIYGDRLPNNMTPYDSYYGISQLHVNKDRPEYLEDCNNLLGQTKQNPQQRTLVEKAISSELSSDAACLSFIEKDKDYISTKEINSLNVYLKKRRNLIEYLRTIRIDFKSLILYKKLEEICIYNNKSTAAEVYQEIVRMMPGLTEATEEEKNKCCEISWKKAWKEFEDNLPPYPTVFEGMVGYTSENTKHILEARNPVSGWTVSDAFHQFQEITQIAPVSPPENIVSWYYYIKRVQALSRLFEIEQISDISKEWLQEEQRCLDAVFEYSSSDNSMRNSPEAGSALDSVQRLYKTIGTLNKEASLAVVFERMLIGIHGRCAQMYKLRVEEENRSSYETALMRQMRSYLQNSSDPNLYANAMDVARTEISENRDLYILYVNQEAESQIRAPELPAAKKMGIYNAVKTGTLLPQLQEKYDQWVQSKFEDGTMDAEMLETLYASVANPSLRLKDLYDNWKRNDNEKRRIEEIIMASKTYVSYIKAVLMLGINADEMEKQEKRRKLWGRLIHEERDMSAFLGAVTYYTNRDPVEFFKTNTTESQILLDEFRNLVAHQDMGILLTKEESFQELYERVLLYKNLTGNTPKLPLYSLNDFDGSDCLLIEDAAGKTARAKMFNTDDVGGVLDRLIKIQNNLCSREEAEKITLDFDSRVPRDILTFFENAGVLNNKSGLDAAYPITRANKKKEIAAEEGFNIRKIVPYIGWGIAAILAIVLILNLIFGGNSGTETPPTPIPTSASIPPESSTSVGDNSVTEELVEPTDESKEKEESAPEGENAAAPDNNITPEQESQPIAEEEKSENPITPDETEIQPNTATFENGQLVSHRAPGENKKAIKVGDEGYDIDGDGTTDLFRISDENGKLIGFGFRQGEAVDFKVIRDPDTGNPIGYDANNDRASDTVWVKGDPEYFDGVDLDGDGICELGFDFDRDGYCEIGFDY